MLAGFFPPTSGHARIGQFDVVVQALQVKQLVGYFPERGSVYPDLPVRSFLDFVAEAKDVPRSERKREIGRVVEACGLEAVQDRIIGHLSKGYRQRVGIAQALIHQPQVLILDEPTIGLDPNQIRQVRDLIKNLGRQHTILLSTHILPEVEMTCSRVIIINKGRIEACDTPENLLNQMRTATGVVLEAKTGKDNGAEELKKIAGVKDVSLTTDGDWQIFSLRAEAETEIRPEVFRLASERHWTVRELSQRKATLEDVFVEITHPEA
jgi:ABC-2 type transport system ATP-binding protein